MAAERVRGWGVMEAVAPMTMGRGVMADIPIREWRKRAKAWLDRVEAGEGGGGVARVLALSPMNPTAILLAITSMAGCLA